MKKILSLLIAFSLTFVFSVNAFATNVPKDKENISSENVYSAKASTAGGSDSGYFHGDGHLYINMQRNKSSSRRIRTSRIFYERRYESNLLCLPGILHQVSLMFFLL